MMSSCVALVAFSFKKSMSNVIQICINACLLTKVLLQVLICWWRQWEKTTSYLVSFFRTFLDSMVSPGHAWFLNKFLKFLIILIYANYFEQSVALRNSNFVCVVTSIRCNLMHLGSKFFKLKTSLMLWKRLPSRSFWMWAAITMCLRGFLKI